jgi:hypothetical protein
MDIHECRLCCWGTGNHYQKSPDVRFPGLIPNDYLHKIRENVAELGSQNGIG